MKAKIEQSVVVHLTLRLHEAMREMIWNNLNEAGVK